MLFFDLDGTLVDSSVGITRCVQYALQGMGHQGLPEAELRGWIGPALPVSFGRLFDDLVDVERAVALYLERFEHEGIREYEGFDGIEEAIRSLQAEGRRMAVVTAKNEPHARRLVASLPFGDAFEDIIGATLDGSLSHKPELIAEALRRFDLAPAACTMIGDRHLDIEGARHHGMPGIGIAWGFGTQMELREAGAAAIAIHPRELPELLALPAQP